MLFMWGSMLVIAPELLPIGCAFPIEKIEPMNNAEAQRSASRWIKPGHAVNGLTIQPLCSLSLVVP